MAPGEAVELRGWRSNSLTADNAPGAALDGVRMSVQLYAAMQRAQQQCPTLGGWEPVAWKNQLLPPPGNSPKSRRGAQRFAPSC
jgi:hypothetical protein